MSKKNLIANLVLYIFISTTIYAADIKSINLLIESKDYKSASEEIEKLLISDSDDPQLLFIKGVLFSEMGKQNEAIKVFEDLSKSHPNLPEPYNNLAVLYAQKGDFLAAKNALEKAIKTHPSYSTAHVNLGDLYTRMASESYNQALQIDKSNQSAKTKLSLIKRLFNFQPIGKNVALKISEENEKAESESNLNVPITINPSQVNEFIESWKTAWSSKDFDNYINHYSLDFMNNKNQNYEEWKKFRKPRIIYKDEIFIEISNLYFEVQKETVEVSFNQTYKSNNISSTSKKTLILKNENGVLKIINEIS